MTVSDSEWAAFKTFHVILHLPVASLAENNGIIMIILLTISLCPRWPVNIQMVSFQNLQSPQVSRNKKLMTT